MRKRSHKNCLTYSSKIFLQLYKSTLNSLRNTSKTHVYCLPFRCSSVVGIVNRFTHVSLHQFIRLALRHKYACGSLKSIIACTDHKRLRLTCLAESGIISAVIITPTLYLHFLKFNYNFTYLVIQLRVVNINSFICRVNALLLELIGLLIYSFLRVVSIVNYGMLRCNYYYILIHLSYLSLAVNNGVQ